MRKRYTTVLTLSCSSKLYHVCCATNKIVFFWVSYTGLQTYRHSLEQGFPNPKPRTNTCQELGHTAGDKQQASKRSFICRWQPLASPPQLYLRSSGIKLSQEQLVPGDKNVRDHRLRATLISFIKPSLITIHPSQFLYVISPFSNLVVLSFSSFVKHSTSYLHIIVICVYLCPVFYVFLKRRLNIKHFYFY